MCTTQTAQVADFKRVIGEVDECIALVCLCGNHDVGDRPNAMTGEQRGHDEWHEHARREMKEGTFDNITLPKSV